MNNDFSKKTVRIIPYLIMIITTIMVLLILAVSISTFKDSKQKEQFFKEFYSGDFQSFINSYNQLNDKKRVEQTYLYLYGISNFNLKQYGNSIESLELFKILYPESTKVIPLIHYLLGAAYFNTGRFDRAVDNLLIAEENGFINSNLYVYLGISSANSADLYIAKEYLQKAGLDSRRIAYFLVNKYIALGMYKEAAGQLEFLIHLAVSEKELYELYVIKTELFPNEALQSFIELSNYITDPILLKNIYKTLSLLYEQDGNLIESKTMIEKSKKIVP